MKQFPEGIRVFQPSPDAPNWVIGQMVITKSELVKWLSAQPKDQLRIDILKAKAGTYYAAVSDFEPRGQKQDIDSGNGRSGGGSTGNYAHTTGNVQVADSDDLPF